jgi:hypothetical protein
MKPSLRLTGRQLTELNQRLKAGDKPRLLHGMRNRAGAPIHTVRGFASADESGLLCGTSDAVSHPAATGWLHVHEDGALSGGVHNHGTKVPFERISVAGDDLLFWGAEANVRHELAANTRNVQAFGEGTIRRLGGLSIAVVGCSGLGFPLAQALAGQGAGRLVLVDPETIEEVNLNRLPCSTLDDVGMLKVERLAQLLSSSAFRPEVVPLANSILTDRRTALEIAECDVIFGCLDSVEARHFLNRLAAVYCIPYFDLGVCLRADGKGGVSTACGSVHYVQPDGSSLLSRGVYDMQALQDEGLRRTDPAEFTRRQAEKYVRGAQEKRPTVLPLNMAVAGLAVMEFMARLHPFRTKPNAEFAGQCLSFQHGMIDSDPDGASCASLSALCGCGDITPFLGLPSFSA